VATGDHVPTANAHSGVGTDKVALKIASDGKGIFALTAFQMSAGATDAGDPIPITLTTKDYIVASRADGLDVTSLILGVKTLKAVQRSSLIPDCKMPYDMESFR
jgi:hypothetical protein